MQKVQFKRALVGVAAMTLAATLTACGQPAAGGSPAPGASSAAPTESKTLTVVSHDSFNIPDEAKKKFETETGYTVKYVAQGDAGSMVNQLVLTKDSPLGDVVFGIDNTFAGRTVSEGVLVPYASAKLPADSADLKAEQGDLLTPIDFGDVCVNADKNWFEAKKLAIPATLDDLTKPEYKDLLVVENAASSSPGLAFLVATVGAKGDGYLDYWGKLKDNGVKVVKDWTQAYSVEFSGGEGKGSRPLVLSYATSPAFTVADGTSSTTALLDTCFRQVEYAGVIKGAQNEVGARKFIDFLLSEDVQPTIAENMYMYPAVKSTKLPAEWVKFAPLSEKPIAVDAAQIGEKREEWIKAWTAKVIG